MGKKIQQFRFYKDDSIKNYPTDLSKATLRSGEAFKEYYPIKQLGIICASEVKFYLNENFEQVIKLKPAEVFNLKNNSAEITNLNFDFNFLKKKEREMANSALIIDLVYEEN